MDINIIDRDFNFIGKIDQFESYLPSKKYDSVGSFELHLDGSVLYADELKKERIIFTEEDKAYVVLYRQRDTEDNKVVVKGRELKSYLSRMLVFPPEGQSNYRINDNAETIMKEYVQATLSRKNITNIEVALNQNRGTSFVYQSRYKNLAEELQKIGAASGLGWDITLDMDRKKFVFDIVEGRDITVNQNLLPPAIFSVDYDNIQSQVLEESSLDYANTAIVAGQGEGADRAIYISGETEGLDSIETFVDARDIENNTDLPDRAMQKLREHEEISVFDSEVLTDKNLIYEEDFRLGDIATIQNKEWDISVNRRITEWTEVYEASGFRLDVAFGENMPTLLDKVKQVTDTPVVEGGGSAEPGQPGDPGSDGTSLDFTWDGTKLGVKKETDTSYVYTELKGADGKTPVKGQDYFDGRSIEYKWRGTELGIRVEGQVSYQYVDLKGKDGKTPVKGVDYTDGKDGKDFTYDDFTPEQLAKLKGEDGYTPVKGVDYRDGIDGKDGDSAYQIWLSKGNVGTVDDYLASLKGPPGTTRWEGIENRPTKLSEFDDDIGIGEGGVGIVTSEDEPLDLAIGGQWHYVYVEVNEATKVIKDQYNLEVINNAEATIISELKKQVNKDLVANGYVGIRIDVTKTLNKYNVTLAKDGEERTKEGISASYDLFEVAKALKVVRDYYKVEVEGGAVSDITAAVTEEVRKDLEANGFYGIDIEVVKNG